MIRTILFDWDGTLVDSLSAWLESCVSVFSSFGLKIEEEDFKKTFFSSSNSIEELAGDKYEEVSEVLFAQVDDWMESMKLADGAIELLRELNKKGFSVNLVTSSFGPTVERVLYSSDAVNFFDHIYGFEDVSNHKPHPEIIFKVMDKLNNKREEMMIVGDSDNDIDSGRRAGIKTCFYYPKQNEEFYCLSENKLKKMGTTIRNFREIWQLLE